MKTLRSADIVCGLLLAALGVVVIIAAYNISVAFAERLPPRTLPLILGWTTVVTGLLLSVRAWRYKGDPIPVVWPDTSGWAAVIVTFVSIFFLILLSEPLGMPIASFLFCTFLIWYLNRRIVQALAVGLATGLILYYVFVRLLEVSLPVGPLAG